jgi:DNA-binding transcriptional MocR family regulator
MPELINSFKDRINLLYSILNGSRNFTVNKPDGGYFIWIKLSDNVDLSKLKSLLDNEKITLFFGENFVQIEDRDKEKFKYLSKRIRICFSFMDVDLLLDGCKLLREAIDNASTNNAKF